MINRQTNITGWVCIAGVLILMFFLDSQHFILYEFNLFVLLLVFLAALTVYLLRRANLGKRAKAAQDTESPGDSNPSMQE